jgi:hypothetical protein
MIKEMVNFDLDCLELVAIEQNLGIHDEVNSESESDSEGESESSSEEEIFKKEDLTENKKPLIVELN